MRARLETSRVAAGAVGLVGGIRPGDRLAGADVAIGAVEFASVLARKAG